MNSSIKVKTYFFGAMCDWVLHVYNAIVALWSKQNKGRWKFVRNNTPTWYLRYMYIRMNMEFISSACMVHSSCPFVNLIYTLVFCA